MSELNPSYWNQLYLGKETGWDIGHISDPLKVYIDGLQNKSIRILIPGAGNSYEGEYLLKHDFTHVTILDYAPEAITNFKKRVAEHEKLTLICEDFFAHTGKYDLILEQTFFCALAPSLRQAYVAKMHELLKLSGRLVGLLFTSVPNVQGPPFAASYEEYESLFKPRFNVLKLEPCRNSIKPRQGRELFFNLTPKV
jgi:SAM-dependent methyltransferase